MKNTIGSSFMVTLFGESHGEAVGAVIDGLAPGIRIDSGFISSQLELRRPYGKISTPRREKDEFRIVSGIYDGVTTGTPVCIIIPQFIHCTYELTDRIRKQLSVSVFFRIKIPEHIICCLWTR